MIGSDCKSLVRCCTSFVFSIYRCVCHIPRTNVPTHKEPKKSVPITPMAAGAGGGGDDDDGGGNDDGVDTGVDEIVVLLLLLPVVAVLDEDDDRYKRCGPCPTK